VHDQLGAALTGMRMRLQALAVQVQGGVAVSAADLLALDATARATQLAARDICSQLRPPMLDDVGLLAACRWYLSDWSAQVGVAASGRFGALRCAPGARLSTDMFRVMQELLTNVARHAGARHVKLSLSGGATSLRLRVQDDGRGFVPAQATAGFGLLGLRERVRQHGGRFDLQSAASGSIATVHLPCSRQP
jgi:signal transduction histidine kinase